MDHVADAIGPIVAFVVISLLTFIGLGIRKIYQFSHRIQALFEKEMTNGHPLEHPDNESTKDLLTGIRDGLQDHHVWAQADAHIRNEELAAIKRQTVVRFPGDR